MECIGFLSQPIAKRMPDAISPFGTREKKFFKLDNFLDVIRNGKTNALHIYRILISYLRADL